MNRLTLKFRLLLVLSLALAPAVVLAIAQATERLSATSAPHRPVGADAIGVWGDVAFILLASLVGLGVLWVIAERWCLRPLAPIQAAAAAIARGNLAPPRPTGSTTPEIQALTRDVFTIAEAISVRETALQASLDQREHMLREIHHRVKNNLQVVSSLLRLQTDKIRSPRIRRLFSDAQDRMLALSILQQHLYERSDWSSVDFQAYITDLARHLLAQRDCVETSAVRYDVQAPVISVGPDTAIPAGMIVTEAVSNALRHAFAGSAAPVIRISAQEIDGKVHIAVVDNGVGFAVAGEAIEGERGLGLALMRGLALQLDGGLDIDSRIGDGTRVRAWLPKPLSATRSEGSGT